MNRTMKIFAVVIAITVWPGCSEMFEGELIHATRKNDIRTARRLLDAGASADQNSAWGTPVLVLAADHGHTDMIKTLLAAGADVNARGSVGQTALHLARKPAIVRMLLDAGININAIDVIGDTTALMYASERGLAAIVRMLLDDGANISLTNKEGLTAAMIAAKNHHGDIVKLLKAAAENQTY